MFSTLLCKKYMPLIPEPQVKVWEVCQVECPEVCPVDSQVDSQVVVCPEDNLKVELIKDLKLMKLIDFRFNLL
jgi:hypothetical protein